MKIWKFLLIGLFTFVATNTYAAPVELDRVSVIVDDEVILQSDIDSAMVSLYQDAQKRNQKLPKASVLEQQVVEKLITDAIQYHQAKQMGVHIDDNKLDKAILDVAKRNNQTLDQLRALLAKEGVKYQTYREQIRREMAISEARSVVVRRRVNILPAEVESLAAKLATESNSTVEYKLQHIQLRFEDNSDKKEVEEKANKLIKELKQDGSNFSEMAITYSKGPKALQGGSWEWMRKEEMPTIFADQITTQGKGSIIGPFRSGVGFHILRIADTKGLDTVAVTEVNARHILIKTSVILSDEGAENLLKEYKQKIEAGETDFYDLAKQNSQDPGSATKGGELGYHTTDIYVPEFKHKLDTLPRAQISEPFKTVHGWHIVEVLNRRHVDKTSTAMKEKAYQIIFKRKFNEEAIAWIREIRAAAFVEFLDNDN